MSATLKKRAVQIGLGATALLIATLIVVWQSCGLTDCPDVDGMRGQIASEASVILDQHGQELGKLFVERRVIVELTDLPGHVPDAFVAMEDRRFWSHHGVDWLRVLGAGLQNVRELGVSEGASTITMQLARNVFPDNLPSSRRTLWRKFREARVAKEIENKFSKRQILELYLNQIYFGNAAHGIETAAQEYFGKSAAELTLAEGATLATIPRSPTRFNPRDNWDLAVIGRAVVLTRMLDQRMITAQQARGGVAETLQLRQGRLRSLERAPYFVEAVRLILDEEVGPAVYREGYTIHTTLDLAFQTVLEEELRGQLLAVEAGAYGPYPHTTYAMAKRDSASDQDGTPYLQAAAVFMNARTGDVRALVGGRDYEDSQYNRVTQAMRQPGSAFKPFVYAAAVAAGYPPSYPLIDRPFRLVGQNGKAWEPQNYDGSYAGPLTMREALIQSRNVPTIRLGMDVGVERVVRMAGKIGLEGRLPSVPSVLLGAAEVTPLALTTAYTTFATLGRNVRPRLITRVEDRAGVVIWSRPPVSTPALSPAVAYIVTSMLKDVVDRGTGTAVRAAGFGGIAAGKTGTTDNAADVWFVGYTPELVGTIWMGFDRPMTVLARATGGQLAAPVWGRVMRRTDQASRDWLTPIGVVSRLVDRYGGVYGEQCPVTTDRRHEYFLSGTGTINSCNTDALYAQFDGPGHQTTDTLVYGGDWQAHLRVLLFGSDTLVVVAPSLAVVTDSAVAR